jgi:type IV secretory pathway VirB4 component
MSRSPAGLEPRLGRAHLRTLTMVGFPSSTFPGLLDELNRLAFAYRWSTRAVMLDKTDATKLTAKIRRQWFAKRKSVAAILKEVMTNEASTLLDSDASNKAADADAALQELGATMLVRPMSPPPLPCGTRIQHWQPKSCASSRRSSRAATSP